MSKEQKHILIVDDEYDVCQHLKLLIERRTGYEVETAQEPAKALEIMRTGTFQLVISDIHMPGMDGIELLKQLKNINPDVEVIMLTGGSSLETAVDALHYRAFDYLEKPIRGSQLLNSIANALSRQQMNTELNQMVQRVSTLNREVRRLAQEHITGHLPQERTLAVAVVLRHIRELLDPAFGGMVRDVENLIDGLKNLKLPEGTSETLTQVAGKVRRVREFLSSCEKSLEPGKITRRAVDLKTFLTTQCQEFSSLFSGVKVTPEIAGDLSEFQLDPERISMALSILLENSVQALHARGDIVVACTRGSSGIQISVEDSGPGFPAGFDGRSLKPFFSTKGEKFSGLGLTMVHAIVKEHGGRMSTGLSRFGGAKVSLEIPGITT